MPRASASTPQSTAKKSVKSKTKSAPTQVAKTVKTPKKVSAAKAIQSKKTKSTLSAIKPLKIPKTTRWTAQDFMVQHLKNGKFKTGLRSYAAYRDLGVHQATDGVVQAHVIRLLGACDPDVVSIRHLHGVQFQFLYMLKGWMIGEYNGRRVKMEEGSCWIQPNSIPHTVLDYSENCEMIELILPGTFKTVEL